MEAKKQCTYIFKGGKRDKERCITTCKRGNIKCSRHKKSIGRINVILPADEDLKNEVIKEVIKKDDIKEDIIKNEIILKNDVIEEQFEIEIDNNIMDSIKADIAKIKFKDLDDKTFDLKKKFGRSIAIFGSSFSGKTQMLRNIIDLYAKKDIITLLQADNIHADVYKGLPKYIYTTDHFRGDIIESWKFINSKKKNKFRFLSITDDIVTGLRHNDTLRKLILSYRNSNLNSIGLFQGLSIINKVERGSINYVVLKGQNDMLIVKDLIDWYLNQSPLFYKYKSLNHKQLLFKEYMSNKENSIIIDNIKGKIFFIKNYI
jgi:hypothetical protein